MVDCVPGWCIFFLILLLLFLSPLAADICRACVADGDRRADVAGPPSFARSRVVPARTHCVMWKRPACEYLLCPCPRAIHFAYHVRAYAARDRHADSAGPSLLAISGVMTGCMLWGSPACAIFSRSRWHLLPAPPNAICLTGAALDPTPLRHTRWRWLRPSLPALYLLRVSCRSP